MKKIVVGIPLALFSALALLVAWANFAPSEDVAAEPNIEEVSNDKSAKGYIKIAWDHWTGSGGFHDEDYEKNLTFITIQSIDAREMATLGVSKEFAELKEAAGYLSGNVVGRLSDEEHNFFYDQFEENLEKIHTAIN